MKKSWDKRSIFRHLRFVSKFNNTSASMSNTAYRCESSNVFTSRLMYSRVVQPVRVVYCIHESQDPCLSPGRPTVFHLTPLSPDGGASIRKSRTIRRRWIFITRLCCLSMNVFFFLNARSAQKTSVFLVLKAPRAVRKQKKYSSF